METETLRWFQQVADGMTVTEIADLEMVSQPGVSRALARLERELGTPLLQRSGRVLRPTRAGNEFKKHVDGLLHSLDDGYAAVNELVDPETGTVDVAFQVSLGGWFVPTLIRGFRDAHPRVQFRLRQSDDALGSSFVAGGRVDLEFTARHPGNPDVHWEHLFTQPLALVVPPTHHLAGRTRVSLSDLADEEFVMVRPSWVLRTLTDEICAAAGFTPRVAFECDDLSVVRGFVRAGLGVAVVPAAEPGRRSRSSHAEPLIRLSDEGAHREVGLVWSRSRRLLPSAELFREYVLDTGLRRLGSR
ncbi:LysR family transcriptional regulator [Marmoricola sp. URHB0036]|uniref:LysR family transcriptional regulator n=1 Tax=Marmoricola sp. URHB0036 TaxID=1298863 RepID=UPI00040B9882|nr:LysR family transcriptional regulator [Marmoricola sp. URHB0036]